MLATAYLKAPAKHAAGAIVALFGTDRFLKQRVLEALSRQILGDGDDDIALVHFAAKSLNLTQLRDELSTVSMWSASRLVVVDEADDFVTEFRSGLEKYADRPAKKSVLVLEVRSWLSTTKLSRKVAQIGLEIDCKSLKGTELLTWLREHCRAAHGKQLAPDAAQLLVELAGAELGLLDQELAKLAAYMGTAASIDLSAVRQLVGGWKAETTWGMLDAVRDGRIDKALQLLSKLLEAGEHPLKLMGGINSNFRSFAQATELARQGMPLKSALAEAGVKPFIVEAAAAYLRRIGRSQAESITEWLRTADGDLKGSSPLPERLVMERLLVQLAGKI